MEFDKEYYQANSQDRDRPALWFYERIWKRYCGGNSTLEFGSGVGFFAKRITKYSKVYGLEINEFALKQFLINAPLAETVDSLVEVPSESIDSIVSLHVLEHISDVELRKIGLEFNRILKDNGRLLIVVPNLTGNAKKLAGDTWMGFRDLTHINLKGSADWIKWFNDEWSMSIVKCAADGYYAFPYGRGIYERIFGDMTRLVKTAIQFICARLVLKPNDGEAVIFILKKRNDNTSNSTN